jgi:hypothetical protein
VLLQLEQQMDKAGKKKGGGAKSIGGETVGAGDVGRETVGGGCGLAETSVAVRTVREIGRVGLG